MEVRTEFIKARHPAFAISFPFHLASLAANVEDRLDLNFTGFPNTLRQPEIGTGQGAHITQEGCQSVIDIQVGAVDMEGS